MIYLHRIYFIIVLFTLIFHGRLGFSDNNKLHEAEVRALKEIGKKLGKKDWDFNKDPCSGEGTWIVTTYTTKGFESNITCDCSFLPQNSSCHVIRIALKSQNLTGIVPPEFSKLRHLKVLDLSRNSLTGSIPKEWASMRLEDLSFMGNRLSGPFPKVLTRLTMLRNLSLEGNQFSGPIPPDIGKLVHLEKLHLPSNAFTGPLTEKLGLLKNLTDMRISDNNFTGPIPDFISNWTRILKLQMHGCGLDGPIPSSISSLTSLTDLRISDLGGKPSSFPPLKNLESIKTLILRKCKIIGPIPKYIGDLKKLKTLDLSFNLLSGEIPSSFENMKKADFIYLTGNKLTGGVPNYFVERNKNVDVSFNNFTDESSIPSHDCNRVTSNLVESFALGNKSHKGSTCFLQRMPCVHPKRYHLYKLYINCGGGEVKVDKEITYQADDEPKGASMYVLGANKRWALSSTGNFMDNDEIFFALSLKTLEARGTFGRLAGQPPQRTAAGGICASSVHIFGYKCEEHDVVTQDGYILNMQRIPEGRAGAVAGDGGKRQPVLIQHGILVDGMSWLLNPADQNLPLILADQGFDVWMGNTRGTRFSRRHKYLNPSQRAFWNWTWDELVSYDLPAMFDHIHGLTGQKIHYLGHSLGTLIGFASFSEKGLVDQVRSAAMLSPVAYLSHMTTVIGDIAAKTFLAEATSILGWPEFNPKSGLVGDFIKAICLKAGIDCYDLVSVITGKNCCLNASTIDLFLANEPQSTSTKNMIHLAQTVRDKELRKYNYGSSDRNIKHYGQAIPPAYNISAIPHELPLFFSYGGLDSLADVKDVEFLLDQFKYHDIDKMNVQFVKDYAHADFIMGVTAKDVVYNQVATFFKRQA